jgi:hypothetical protein
LRACSCIKRSIRCRPHDSPSRQQVSPHPPGAVGPMAGKEAGADLRAELLITAAACTAWPGQPRIEAAARDTERLAHPVRRPDPPVLRNETELHVDSFAKQAAVFFRMSRTAFSVADFALELRDLELLRLHPALAGECILLGKQQVMASNSAISALFRITIGAKFPSRMNPLSQS